MGRPSRMPRPRPSCTSPSIRGCSRPTRLWPRSRSRSGRPKTSKSVWPRSAKTVPASPNLRGAEMSGPLSGIRVVDFSRVLAGPLCARTLLDLGAEVIKIEPPRPDVSRFAFPSTPGMSGYYAQQNAGKRNVSIDLNVPGARELALRLCDTADVVVENFRAGTLRYCNERAHVDLNDVDLGDEPAILGATDCPFFSGPGGEHFTVATSLVGSRTFPSYLRAMRRADLADDLRFATAAARRAHFADCIASCRPGS